MRSDAEITQSKHEFKKEKKSGGTLHLRSIPSALMIDCISEQPYPDAALHNLINSCEKRAGPMILIMSKRVVAKAITSSRSENCKLLKAKFTYENLLQIYQCKARRLGLRKHSRAFLNAYNHNNGRRHATQRIFSTQINLLSLQDKDKLG